MPTTTCCDCGMCEEPCYYGAISRRKLPNNGLTLIIVTKKEAL